MSAASATVAKPRILFISTARTIGGGEIYLANMLPQLKAEYDCTVLATKPVMELLKKHAVTHHITLFPKSIERIIHRSYRVKKTYYRLYLARFLKKHRFDIINLQEFDGAFVEALDFNPIILTEQTRMFIPPNLQEPFRRLFGKIEKVVCVSNQTQDDVTSLGVPKEKCIVIHNGVDTEKFMPSKNSGEYITWVGRVEEEDKNPILFLQIAAAAAAEGLDYKFRLVGDGRAMSKMRSYANKNNLNNLEIVGAVHPKEMLNIYRQAKILCMTSKTEGLPYVALEAMACGVPVVSTNIGGLSEIISNKKIGALIEGFDKEKFLAEIKKYMEDDKLYDQTRQAARKRIENDFSMNLQIQTMKEQYQKLLNKA